MSLIRHKYALGESYSLPSLSPTFPLFIIICLVLCNSCSYITPKSKAVLKYSIDTAVTKKIYLAKSENWIRVRDVVNPTDSANLMTSEKGLFTINVSKWGFYQVFKQNKSGITYPMFLQPGDTAYVRKTVDTVIVKVTSRPLYDYFKKSRDYAKTVDTIGRNQYIKWPPNRFSQYQQFVLDKMEDFRNRYCQERKCPPPYKKYLKLRELYQITNRYFKYLKSHTSYNDDTLAYFKADKDFYSFLSSLPLKEPFNKHLYFYYSDVIENYIEDLARRQHNYYGRYMGKKQQRSYFDRLNWGYQLILDTLKGINQDIAFTQISQPQSFTWVLRFSDDKNTYRLLDSIHNHFKNKYTKNEYWNYFHKNYEKLKRIAPSQPAPDFSLPDTSGNYISLSDLKGRVVFIDFWATWCRPCIQLIPKQRQLRNSFRDNNNVIFLNIALEEKKNQNRWKKFVKDKNYPGLHLLAKGEFDNRKIGDYLVQAIPTYVLIDSEGKIIETRVSHLEFTSVKNKIKRLIPN